LTVHPTEEAERTIVEAIAPVAGQSPVILCGSRATGDASEGSDYDVFVLLPARRVPLVLGDFAATSRALENQLGVSVSVNPLPAFRLRHPGRSLLVWKLRREGKVLSAPPGFTLGPDVSPQLSRRAASSYALSGLCSLVEDLAPEELAGAALSPELTHAVEKAILYAAQLSLMRNGAYASRLSDALSLVERMEGNELAELARSSDRPGTWLKVRDILVQQVDHCAESLGATILGNAQFIALAALRNNGFHPQALVVRPSVRIQLTRTLTGLARCLGRDGYVNQASVAALRLGLPGLVRPAGHGWTALRDAVLQAWPHADPLVGL
jgi:predicted nucleotidyltransferase